MGRVDSFFTEKEGGLKGGRVRVRGARDRPCPGGGGIS